MRPEEKPSKGLVSRMRQLRGGCENQEDEEMKILNASKKKTKTIFRYNSKLHVSGAAGID